MSYEYAMSIINAPVETSFDEGMEVEVSGLNPGYEEDVEVITMTTEDAARKILSVLSGKTPRRRGRPRKEK
jgi:hypothetical protein